MFFRDFHNILVLFSMCLSSSDAVLKSTEWKSACFRCRTEASMILQKVDPSQQDAAHMIFQTSELKHYLKIDRYI